jgi:hypothetical protein
VAALPATNLYLQGRNAGTPDRRGITRLHELTARGVEVVIGTDNVRDAFCPVGRHDPLHSLSLAVLAGHLDPPFGRHLRTITSARARRSDCPLTVDGAAIGDLIWPSTSPSLSGLITGAPRLFPYPSSCPTSREFPMPEDTSPALPIGPASPPISPRSRCSTIPVTSRNAAAISSGIPRS